MTKYKVLTPVLQGGVIVASGEIELDDKQALRLQELGAIGEEIPEESVPLEEMKLPALKVYAKDHNIDLGEATKREDVLAAILKAGESDGGVS
ncbi:hypothetical protein NSQ91_09005 [Paenibacillus sp. FSL R7-0048]|uniref:hypothetical protein n=1 Tax=Paenibacillus TaxID=44249 RepID=UPI00096ECB07|nr:hypothetical protein [Paenibacillus odorifer]OMD73355.1 hypothetical protein BSK48_05690 [Paenibacillus odorifer]